MRVEQKVVVNAPREAVWDFITEPANYTRFFTGITRWDCESRKKKGCGARYAMRMAVGSAEIGGLIEVVEFDEPADMAWTSVTGIDHRGRWRLRERGPNRTLVQFRLSWNAPGGMLGWLSDQFSAPFVKRNLRSAVESLKRQVEAELAAKAQRAARAPAKKRAAKKRAARTAA
jgi:uncharacterized membrane protein